MRCHRAMLLLANILGLLAVIISQSLSSPAMAQRRVLDPQFNSGKIVRKAPKSSVKSTAKIIPIVFRFGTPDGIEAGTQNALLLGGAKGMGWATISETARSLRGGEKYRFYGVSNTVGTAVGSRTSKSVASGVTLVPFRRGPDALAHLIGVSGAKNPMPIKPTVLSNAHSDYLRIVAQVLREHGISNTKPNIRRIIRVRLDGKSDAVLIEASTPKLDLSLGSLKRDQYSMVLLRTIVNGVPKTYEVMSAFGTTGKAGTHGDIICNLVGAYDLNGDGKLEIAVAWHYYEGYGAAIFEVVKGTPRLALESADGV